MSPTVVLRAGVRYHHGSFAPGLTEGRPRQCDRRTVTTKKNKPRAAATPSALDADHRDPESVWLNRVRAIYDPRAYRWVEQVHGARRRAQPEDSTAKE